MKQREFLHKLYQGKIQPEERCPVTSRYQNAMRVSIGLEEKLRKQLGKEQRKLLSQLMKAENLILKEEAFLRFCQGVRLGARLIDGLLESAEDSF